MDLGEPSNGRSGSHGVFTERVNHGRIEAVREIVVEECRYSDTQIVARGANEAPNTATEAIGRGIDAGVKGEQRAKNAGQPTRTQ